MHSDQVRGFFIEMLINNNKQIVDTVFIVEGETEKILLKRILGCVFGYEIICQGNRDTRYLKFSRFFEGSEIGRIAIFCSKESNIESIVDIDHKDHIDQVVTTLNEECNFDIRNSCVFYLFDRDPKSNTNAEAIRGLLQNLKNPYENDDFSYGGLMLISYPCIESYKISNFTNDTHLLEGEIYQDIKSIYATNPNMQDNKINDKTILNATIQMLEWYDQHSLNIDHYNMDYRISDCFEIQENYLSEKSKFRLLSGLSCAFIELGIIEIED